MWRVSRCALVGSAKRADWVKNDFSFVEEYRLLPRTFENDEQMLAWHTFPILDENRLTAYYMGPDMAAIRAFAAMYLRDPSVAVEAPKFRACSCEYTPMLVLDANGHPALAGINLDSSKCSIVQFLLNQTSQTLADWLCFIQCHGSHGVTRSTDQVWVLCIVPSVPCGNRMLSFYVVEREAGLLGWPYYARECPGLNKMASVLMTDYFEDVCGHQPFKDHVIYRESGICSAPKGCGSR